MSTAREASSKREADKVIHTTARLRCDAHYAFELFTVGQLLQTWLAPVAEVEPHVGGKYWLFWEPSLRENNSTLGCRITALQPDQFLSFEWKGPTEFKGFMNDADPLTHVVVCFIPAAGGRALTDVHLIHSGWRSTPDWEAARQWFEVSWRNAFAELEKQVNGTES
ncbi:MAG TPA: SRPBCC domain-containing protein [Pyrinomonadaceae bacterium]|jgi:uncharacterized protein YndB with AHSA1/START domain|nr:SRPBCC domain-containing protein [Pyrinomonadaceae bacterium]